MSDFRFGFDGYSLNYHPHEGVYEEDGYIDWSKVECVEIEWVDFVRKPDDKSRWFQLFGTPERAARTIADSCRENDYECGGCPAVEAYCHNGDYDALLEWLRGDTE